MTVDVTERAREVVREYLSRKGVIADMRAGRLPVLDDRLVRQTVATLLEEQEEITPEIRSYMIAMLRAPNEKNPTRGTREPLRDLHIAVAVYLAKQVGLDPTSNRERKIGSDRPPSASSVVFDQLNALNMAGRLTERSIEQLWTRFKKRAAPGFMPEDA